MKSPLLRIVACIGLALALFIPARARADDTVLQAIPYFKLLQKYGAYEALIDVVLEQMLAVEKRETVVKMALGVPQASARLEVYKFAGTIHAEGSDSCWLGDNHIRLRVPVEFRYEIDLGKLTSKDIQYDPSRNVLEVKLPAVTLAKVVPDYASLEVTEKVNPTFRSKASWYELKEWVVSEQISPNAEVLGNEKISEASLVARGVMHDLLGKLYAPATQFKGIVIVVK